MTASKVVVPTPDEIRAWKVTVSVPVAGSAWGIGPRGSYQLARQGAFPVPVLRLGGILRVKRSEVLSALGIPEVAPAGLGDSQEAA
jgi:hypothetical protein